MMNKDFAKDLPPVTQFYGEGTIFAPEKPADPDAGDPRRYRCVSCSDKPTTDFRRIVPESLPTISADFNKGQPIMVNHDTWGADALPIGKTTASKFLKSKNIVETDFYLDNEDYTDRITKGIDNGTLSDVSIGADGKFKCSFDNSPMSFWWGCQAAGHYRGDQIMVDADGNETKDVNEAVSTIYIYADFYARLADELSIVWAGAVQDATIRKVYNRDPEQNQAIVNAVAGAYHGKHIDDHQLQRLTASYGGAAHVLGQAQPQSKIFLPNSIRSKPMNNEQMTPEIQQILTEKDATIAGLEAQVAAAEQKAVEAEAAQPEALQASIKTNATLVTEKAELEAKVAELTAKGALYDTYVAKLRVDLKTAKRLSGASEAEQTAFNTVADGMTNPANMSTLLDEIRSKQKGSPGSYSRIITVEKTDENAETGNEAIQHADRARIMAAY